MSILTEPDIVETISSPVITRPSRPIGPRSPERRPRPARHVRVPDRRSQLYVIVLGTGLLSLGMSIWQITRPELVGVYDSGVYLAASIRLISGALPYKDFVFVQPPGILICLSPAALFSRVFGSHDGMILARVMTAFVSAANVSLLCLLVRHRGRTAMIIAGLGLAFMPIAVDISSALFLEQYVVFFVLLGALVIFSPLATRPRMTTLCLVLGGTLFGFAGLVKVWAFFPFLAMSHLPRGNAPQARGLVYRRRYRHVSRQSHCHSFSQRQTNFLEPDLGVTVNEKAVLWRQCQPGGAIGWHDRTRTYSIRPEYFRRDRHIRRSCWPRHVGLFATHLTQQHGSLHPLGRVVCDVAGYSPVPCSTLTTQPSSCPSWWRSSHYRLDERKSR